MSLKVYLINLDRAPDRLNAVKQNLDAIHLKFERVIAVDGAALSFPNPKFSERSYRYLHMRKTNPAEIGCYLSHINCMRQFLSSDGDHALILEDDVSFSAGFPAVLNLALADKSWDILRLSTVNSGRKFSYKPLNSSFNLAISLTREKGAGAYLVNRRAAEWLLKRMMPMRLAYDIAFDLEYLFGLRASFISPTPISQASQFYTQIQNDLSKMRASKWYYITAFPFRAFLETTRFLIRSNRLLYLLLLEKLNLK